MKKSPEEKFNSFLDEVSSTLHGPDYGIVADLDDRIADYLYPTLAKGKVNRLLRECEETLLSALIIVEDALDDPVTKHQARKSSNQIRKVLGKLHEWEQQNT